MSRLQRFVYVISLLTLMAGCDLPHGHSHDGPDGHAHDAPKTQAKTGHADHAAGGHDDHGGHGDDHADGHGHDPGAIAVTHFTDVTELFVEYPTLFVGGESAFAAHLTRLDDYRPVAEGQAHRPRTRDVRRHLVG